MYTVSCPLHCFPLRRILLSLECSHWVVFTGVCFVTPIARWTSEWPVAVSGLCLRYVVGHVVCQEMYGCTDLVILLLFFFFLSMNILWMVRSGFEKSSYLALALNVTGYTYPWLLKERVLFLCAYVRAHTCAYMYISLWQCGVISAIVICGALVLFSLSFCQVLVEWSTERLACLPLANGAGTTSTVKFIEIFRTTLGLLCVCMLSSCLQKFFFWPVDLALC